MQEARQASGTAEHTVADLAENYRMAVLELREPASCAWS